MKYSPSFEDVVAMTGDILAVLETVKGSKFRKSSRVCRRIFASKNELNKIPENEEVDFKKIVCLSRMELIPSSKARATPPGKPTAAAPAKEQIRKRRGFWKVFKLKGTDKKKTNHYEFASMLNFV